MPNETETIEAKEAAAMLGLSQRYFSESFIFINADFPQSFRLTPSGRRRWKRAEVEAFIERHREQIDG